jgi:hypothetical protein
MKVLNPHPASSTHSPSLPYSSAFPLPLSNDFISNTLSSLIVALCTLDTLLSSPTLPLRPKILLNPLNPFILLDPVALELNENKLPELVLRLILSLVVLNNDPLDVLRFRLPSSAEEARSCSLRFDGFSDFAFHAA